MMFIDHLPAAIERRWKRDVDDDLVANPLSEESGEAPTSIEDPTRYVPYGTTLLSVLVTRDFAVYFQLGDGDILTVSATGEVERVIQPDPMLIANQTTSLCLPQARRHFRTKFQRIAGPPPALVILCSDGYANSFEEAGFLKAGADYLHLIHTKGIDHVNDHLEQWLSETSQNGSGDDITVGIIAAPDLDACIKDRGDGVDADQQRCPNPGNSDDVEPRLARGPAGTRLQRILKSSSLIRLQQAIRGLIHRTAGRTDTIRLSIRRSPCSEGRGGC
jgi:hypothetical protein